MIGADANDAGNIGCECVRGRVFRFDFGGYMNRSWDWLLLMMGGGGGGVRIDSPPAHHFMSIFWKPRFVATTHRIAAMLRSIMRGKGSSRGLSWWWSRTCACRPTWRRVMIGGSPTTYLKEVGSRLMFPRSDRRCSLHHIASRWSSFRVAKPSVDGAGGGARIGSFARARCGDWKCMFVGCFETECVVVHSRSMVIFVTDCGVANAIWRRSPISFKYECVFPGVYYVSPPDHTPVKYWGFIEEKNNWTTLAYLIGWVLH